MIHTNLWRHIKSGTLYELMNVAVNEADLKPSVIYRKVGHNKLNELVWVRPASEFFDGRFLPHEIEDRS